MPKEGDKNGISVRNTTKGRLVGLPFVVMKNAILGKKYNLSLVFAGDKLTQRLNTTYRNKNKPTNVLSFPLSKNEGEIFINPGIARIEAKINGEKVDKRIGYLFIHGLLHLKGMQHGSKMDSEESKYVRRFFGNV